MGRRIAVAVVVAGLALAPPAWAADATITAEINALQFTPAEVTVNVGDTVTVSRAEGGAFAHNSDYDDLPPCPASATTAAWSCPRTFTIAGDYAFHCDLHTSMTATVHVVPPPQSYEWTGSGGDGLWTTAANWKPAGVPGDGNPADDATVAGAEVVLDADKTIDQLTLSGGAARAGSGTLTVTGSTAASGARFRGTGVTRFTANGFALGGLAVEQGATVRIIGTSTLSGTVKMGDGSATDDDPVLDNAGVMALGGGGFDDKTAGRAELRNNGQIAGSGTLAVDVVNSGVISPGASPGTMTIAGSFTQAAGGTLRTEIAGASAFDQLHVGSAALSGTLAIVSTFTPAFTDTFDVLVADGGLTGTFATVSGATLADRRYVPGYAATGVKLRVEPTATASPTPEPSASPTPPPSASPTPAPTEPPTPRKVAIGKLAKLPRGCASRKRYRISLRNPGALASARVFVNGKRVAALKGAALRSRIKVGGIPKGRFTLKVTVTRRDGSMLFGSRRLRAC